MQNYKLDPETSESNFLFPHSMPLSPLDGNGSGFLNYTGVIIFLKNYIYSIDIFFVLEYNDTCETQGRQHMEHLLLQTETGKGPKYRRIADQLISQIAAGKLKPGERLPGERAFAKQTGLSVATVIAVMNDLESKGYAVRRRGSGTYIANPEPLRRPRIGFVAEPHDYSKRIFGELWTFCHRNKCDLLPLIRTFDQLESAIAEYRLNGLLVYNQGNFSREAIQRIHAKGVPLFLLSTVQEELADYSFGYSNEELVHDAVRYLASLGHTKIGFLLDRDNIIPNRFRREFFLKTMWELRLPVNPEWVVTNGLEEQLPRYFASRERPDAVILGSGLTQPLVSRGLEACKLHVPGDLSVVVLDDYFELYSRETLKIVREYTCFRINVADFSVQAAEYLLRKIRGEKPEKPCVRNYEFVDAGTCRPPSKPT